MRNPLPVLLLAGGLAGCSFDTTGPAGDVDATARADAATADAAAGTDAAVDADPAPDQPGCVVECLGGDQLNDCQSSTPVECELGCVDQPTPHCGELVPSNGAHANQLSAVSGGVDVAADLLAEIDSDDGTIVVDDETVREPFTGVGPSGIGFFLLDDRTAVLAVADFTVGERAYLRVHGTRALIVLSRGPVSIRGLIDVGAGCGDLAEVWCAGPGGGGGAIFGESGGGGCGPGGDGWGGSGVPDSGGGGGALGKAGGDGGDGGDYSLGGVGGDPDGCPGASAVPLRGGSGGGTGGEAGSGPGGGGGGALQITSFDSISIAGIDAAIWAAGAGGGGTSDASGGGGGGAGGTILLEAPAIELDGCALAANGGGGGHGDGGTYGEYGLLSTSPAEGGSSTEVEASGGGAGGARYADAQPGDGPIDGGGGGGGGVGILRFNVPAAALVNSGAILSPQESRGDLTVE